MDAIAQWNAEVERLTAKGLAQGEAVRKLAIEQPELHQEYLEQYNDENKRRRLGR